MKKMFDSDFDPLQIIQELQKNQHQIASNQAELAKHQAHQANQIQQIISIINNQQVMMRNLETRINLLENRNNIVKITT